MRYAFNASATRASLTGTKNPVYVTLIIGDEGPVHTSDVKLKHAPTPTPPPVVASPATRQAFLNQADAPPCHVCGTITVRNGACYKCHNCGATSGCS